MANVVIADLVAHDPASATPIHAQIEERIRLAIAGGQLPADARLPTARALADALGIHPNTVGRVYSTLAREGVLAAHRRRGTFVARAAGGARLRAEREARLNTIVTRAQVEALSLGFTPEQIEASFVLRLARFREEAVPEAAAAAASMGDERTLVVMGSHDLALDLLAGHVRRLSGVEMTSTHTGSLGGLIALARGEAHVAGCHLLDAETGEYNVPFVRRVLAGVPVDLINVARRTQGLLLPRGNPKGIQGLEDLARPDVTMINRQRGSGTRVLLDFLLGEAGLDPDGIRGYGMEVDTHTAVAAAVVAGQVDTGLGILAAARALGLDFLPLRDERYDLAALRASRDLPQMVALRVALTSREFQRSVRELGGYDTSLTGTTVAEVDG